MIWVGVTGSWRKSSLELEQDTDREVNAALHSGKGIVTGGALGVDYRATERSLTFAPDGSRLKVFLPTSLEVFTAHYRLRADEGVISMEQAEMLIRQLLAVQSAGSLIENTQEKVLDKRTYYLRNTQVVEASDELLAFQVNESLGTQDTIDKAREKGLSVKLFSYTVA